MRIPLYPPFSKEETKKTISQKEKIRKILKWGKALFNLLILKISFWKNNQSLPLGNGDLKGFYIIPSQ